MNNTSMFDKNHLDTLLEQRRYPTLIRYLDELSPIDAAEYLASLPKEKLPLVFRLLKKDTASLSSTCFSPVTASLSLPIRGATSMQ